MNAKLTGRFIQQKRKDMKLTQTELAELLQVTDKAISRWETGEGFPEVTMLPRLATIFNVTIDDLLNGEQKIESTRLPAHIQERFKLSTLLELLAIVLGYLVGVMLIYLTEVKYWALLPYSVLTLVSLGFYYYHRYKFITETKYDDSDKQLIKRNNRVITRGVLYTIYLLMPQFILVFSFSFLGSTFYVEDAYLTFTSYIWVSLIFLLVLGGMTELIFSMLNQKESGMKKQQQDVIKIIYSFFILLYTVLIFIINANRLAKDTQLYILPFIGLLLFAYPIMLAIMNFKHYKLTLLSYMIITVGALNGIITHRDYRLENIADGWGGQYESFLPVFIPFMIFGAIALFIIIFDLIHLYKRKDQMSHATFYQRTLIYIIGIFASIFYFIGEQNVSLTQLFVAIIIFVWVLIEVVLITLLEVRKK